MGFAKEIEDFLNGYKAVSSIAGDNADRALKKQAIDAEMAKAEAADLEGLAVDPEKYLPPSQQAALKRAPKAASTASPGADLTLNAPYGDTPGEAEEPVVMAAGGVVPDDEEDVVGENRRSALPIDNPAAATARSNGKTHYTDADNAMRPLVAMNGKPRNTYGDPTRAAPEGAPKSTGPGLAEVFAGADKAIRAAFEGFKQDASAPRQAIGGAAPEVDFRTGRGAATLEEIKAIDAKIDPDNSMDPWVKGRARLGYAYNFFVSRGEPEKAANVAKRILLFDKMASQARGKIAVEMIKAGNPQRAAEVVADAYNDNIHDGTTIEVKPQGDGKFAFTVSKDGEVVSQGIGSQQDLAALAGNVANGSEFVRRTARIAAGPDDGTAPEGGGGQTDTSGAAAGAAPAPGPASALPVGEAAAPPAAPAPPVAPPAAPAPSPKSAPKGKRDIAWAKKQYTYAASVMKYWEDEVAKNPSPENNARLKDAQIRMSEAEQDAHTIRLSTATKNADKGNIALTFDKTLAEWREAADPLAEAPPAPKDGLRGAAAPAGQPVTTSSKLGAELTAKKSGEIAQYSVDGQIVEGPWQNLKPAPPELVAEMQKGIAAGYSKKGMLELLLKSGYDPTGL